MKYSNIRVVAIALSENNSDVADYHVYGDLPNRKDVKLFVSTSKAEAEQVATQLGYEQMTQQSDNERTAAMINSIFGSMRVPASSPAPYSNRYLDKLIGKAVALTFARHVCGGGFFMRGILAMYTEDMYVLDGASEHNSTEARTQSFTQIGVERSAVITILERVE